MEINTRRNRLNMNNDEQKAEIEYGRIALLHSIK